MVKILHTIPALDGGGADRVIYDYCLRMMPDLNFDFIVHSESKGILEDDLIGKSCKIFHIQPARNGKLAYFKSIYKILKENDYDMIHVSQGYWGFIYILFAWLTGIKVRIAHAHMANVPETKFQTIKRKIFSSLTTLFATDLFACGIDAAKWMWGKKNYELGKVKIMVNAIDGEKFDFDVNLRVNLRQEWQLQDNFVIGNVGRLAYQKNQSFLIDIFNQIHQIEPSSKLVLIGRGELEKELKDKVYKLGLNDSVIFTGVRNDVHELLNLLDIFVLPSRFEGLPITLIEVQMNGLPVIVSDNITEESKFTNIYQSLSLNSPIAEWVQGILNMKSQRVPLSDIIKKERDVNYLAVIQKDWYLKRMENL